MNKEARKKYHARLFIFFHAYKQLSSHSKVLTVLELFVRIQIHGPADLMEWTGKWSDQVVATRRLQQEKFLSSLP